MSANNWRIPEGFEGWMRAMEKRMAALERRPVVTTPQDLLGPSLGPWAVHIENANSDEASLNGFWHLHQDAANSPSNDYGWMGVTIAEATGWGVQIAYRVHDAAGILATGSTGQIRRFFTPNGEVGRTYGSWETL